MGQLVTTPGPPAYGHLRLYHTHRSHPGRRAPAQMREKAETLASHHQEDSRVIGHPLPPRSLCPFSQPSAPEEQDPEGTKEDGPTRGLLPTDTKRAGMVGVKGQEVPATHRRPVRLQVCSTRKRIGIFPTLEALK